MTLVGFVGPERALAVANGRTAPQRGPPPQVRGEGCGAPPRPPRRPDRGTPPRTSARGISSSPSPSSPSATASWMRAKTTPPTPSAVARLGESDRRPRRSPRRSGRPAGRRSGRRAASALPRVLGLDCGQAGDALIGPQEAEQRVGGGPHPVAPPGSGPPPPPGRAEEFGVDLAEDGREAGVQILVLALERGAVDSGALEHVLQLADLRSRARRRGPAAPRAGGLFSLISSRPSLSSGRIYFNPGPRPPAGGEHGATAAAGRRIRWTASDGRACGPSAP